MEAKSSFQLTVEEYRRLPMFGDPVSELPLWGGVAEFSDVTYILHPPIDFEIAYCVNEYVLVLPFSNMPCDLAINEGPMRRQAIRGGGVMLVPPLATIRAKVTQPTELLVVSVSCERAQPVLQAAGNGSAISRPLVDFLDPGVTAIAQEMRRALLADALLQPAYMQSLADSLLSRIACLLADSGKQRGARERLAPRVLSAVTSRIDASLGGRILVEDLASEHGLSRAHFSRAFRASTGQSPQEYIMMRRLNLGRQLLTESDTFIASIAATAGFSSQAHFTTAFKKRMGLSPAKYREAFRATDAPTP